MSERTEPNLNEMINSAGDGSGLQLPPAFVMVNPKQHRKYKKNNEKVDGRTKGARSLFDRIQKRKMKEETNVTEALSTDTERAQKQITQGKKLNRQKDLQKKRGEAKEKVNCDGAPWNQVIYEYMWGPTEFHATGNLVDFDLSNQLHKIDIPVLFLTGEFDEARPETISKFHKMIPGSEFIIIKDVAHASLSRAPDDYRRILEVFLDEVEDKQLH